MSDTREIVSLPEGDCHAVLEVITQFFFPKSTRPPRIPSRSHIFRFSNSSACFHDRIHLRRSSLQKYRSCKRSNQISNIKSWEEIWFITFLEERFLKPLLIVSLLIWIVYFSLISTSQSIAQDNPNLIIGVETVDGGRNHIIIKAQHVLLPALLEKIEAKSGIRFRVQDKLLNNSISLDIQENNWAQAVLKVIEDCIRVELWNSETELTELFLLERQVASGELSFTNKVPPSPSEQASEKIKNGNESFTREQLRILVRGPFRSPIPAFLDKNLLLQVKVRLIRTTFNEF